MRRTAALLALVAMASSSTAALAQGRARADAVVVESALGKIAATTTRHAGSVVWTQKDPLGFAAGDTSLYVYALGDPVSYVDPSGEICFIPLIFLVIKAADFAMNAWDTYQLIKKFMDPCISDDDKAAELALLAAQWLGGKVLGSLLNKLQKSKALAKFGCFAAGTLVATSTGLVPIEAVEPGTVVQGRNDSSGEVEWRTVTANHARPDVPTLAIGIEDEREGSWQLTTTAEHPIYVAGVGYVPAARLEPGQWLAAESGALSRVVSVAATGAAETVYNLTVDGTENYFVGPSPVLVHNIDLRCGGIQPELGKKHEYFLGNATGNAHNVERSRQMASQLDSIGLHDTPATRDHLTDHLTKTLNDPSSVARTQDNGRVVRDSLLMGPQGGLKFETVWEGAKLITGNLFGGR